MKLSSSPTLAQMQLAAALLTVATSIVGRGNLAVFNLQNRAAPYQPIGQRRFPLVKKLGRVPQLMQSKCNL
jgi:hypothetical protein